MRWPAVAGLVGALAAGGAGKWHVSDLHAPPGANNSTPVAINEHGDVLVSDISHDRSSLRRNGRWVDLGSHTEAADLNDDGVVVGAHNRKAFRWSNGELTDLAAPGFPANAVAVNGRGEIVGNALRKGHNHAFVWASGAVTDLGADTTGVGINDAGQVIGYLRTFAGGERAFVWQNGKRRLLGTLPPSQIPWHGKQYVEPVAINEHGVVAGLVHDGIGTYQRWFVWRGSRLITKTLPFRDQRAAAVNEKGQVLIGASGGRPASAYVWRNGQLAKLPTLGGDSTFAVDLNDAGQVVGMSRLGGHRQRPFVWQAGKMTALSMPARRYTPPWGGVSAINDRGDVIGFDYTDDGTDILRWSRR